MNSRIWITWENQVRNQGLADHFDFELYILETNQRGALRYTILVIKTLLLIVRKKPSSVACQNPSIILALSIHCLRAFYKYNTIVDRHTNFKFDTARSLNPKWILFHCLSKWTIRLADITIVTNSGLARIVRKFGGNPKILPDKIVESYRQDGKSYVKPSSRLKVFYVCTFAYDEPTQEVIEVAKKNIDKVDFYISGNWRKLFSSNDLKQLPDNVILLDFLDYKDYLATMNECDVVLSITLNKMTLTCGTYEGLSLGKTVIGSNTYAMRRYFDKNIFYVRVNSSDIFINDLNKLVNSSDLLKHRGIQSKEEMQKKWISMANSIAI